MKSFRDLPTAFDYCREVDRPADVLVRGCKWRLYPSGKAEQLEYRDEDQLGEEWHELAGWLIGSYSPL